MLIKQISVVIIAKNAEGTIGESLDALNAFDEVLLYLNNSTDNTKSIAKNYDNVHIVEGAFFGFGKTKNEAGRACKHDWILSLDSDEVILKLLLEELKLLKLDNKKEVFILKRDNILDLMIMKYMKKLLY